MKSKLMTRIGLLAVSIVLAAMGCWFCWNCPMESVYGSGQHVLFQRQVLWNALGIVLFAGASLMRWNWWQKAAPWLMLGWIALAVWGVAFGHPIHGSYRWVDLGVFKVNVRTLLVLVLALFAAWLCAKKRVKPWMVFLSFGLLGCVFGGLLLCNTNRLARFVAWLSMAESSPSVYASYQMKAAFHASQWFGGSGLSLHYLPCRTNDAMASASAILFGRWFPLAVCALFGALGMLLTSVWKRVGDSSRRMFLLFWGVGLLFPAFYSLFQCVGLLPVCGFSLTLVGYGGTGVLVFWIGLGIVFSLLREEDEASGSRKFGMAVGAFWCAVFALYACGICRIAQYRFHFSEPPPNTSDLGEFGIKAKRGEILAADGSLLARTRKGFQVRLDPRMLRVEAGQSTQECYRVVADCLGLPEAFVSNQYARTDSRYIKLLDDATPKIVDACKSLRMSQRYGLILEPKQCRDYPLGSNAVHVVGCIEYPIQEITRGFAGLEYLYDSTLRGKNGSYDRHMTLAEKIAHGRPTNGGTVETTIVPHVQVALAESLAAAAAVNGAESGWGIVLKVPTGEIEAMASTPIYNPLKRDKSVYCSYRNNAVQMQLEPGGLMKPITYAMAMDAGLITSETKIDHGNGIWEYAQTNFHDSCTGELTVAESLVRRSNIAAGKVGVMLGVDRFVRDLPRFGFARKVGGRTLYGEEVGLSLRRERYDPVSISRLGMGYSTSVTGIKMVNAYAVFANDGVEVLPHLVGRTTDADGKEVFQFQPRISTNRVLSVETAQKMRGLMEEAFKATVAKAGVDLGGMRVVGAVTETALSERGIYSPTNYNVAVVGLLPAEKPEYVVAVGFQKPKGNHAVEGTVLPAFAEVVRKLKKGE